MTFPSDFVWGAGAASYQIEGAWNEGGRGLSVWDMMARQPGRIAEGQSGNVACDHYHRYPQDVGLMKEMGLKAYRLSVSWPRVLPEGTGSVNRAGLEFYDKLIDELLAARVDPWVTLFHWDFPYALYLRGGWLNADSPKWFAEYTKLIVDRLSDRVKHWITLNEPQCFIGLGHLMGEHAPGLKLGLEEALLAGHHSLIAHGLAVEVIRTRAKTEAADRLVARHAQLLSADRFAPRISMRHAQMTEAVTVTHTFWNNTWWGDPPILGQYPEEGLRVSMARRCRSSSRAISISSSSRSIFTAAISTPASAVAGGRGRQAARRWNSPSGHPHHATAVEGRAGRRVLGPEIFV